MKLDYQDGIDCKMSIYGHKERLYMGKQDQIGSQSADIPHHIYNVFVHDLKHHY